MIYLDRIIIEYIQSHKKTILDLDEGVNIIHGISGSGKTAILRAINLLVNNRPSGARFYSNFAPEEGDSNVIFRFSDDTEISLTKRVKRNKKDRKKSLIKTIYSIGGKEFEPGTDIPAPVRSYLNIGEINIQKQFERPFLILSSPGEIGRTINRITQLEEADQWKQDLTRKINRKKQEFFLLHDQAKGIETELSKYEGVEDLDQIMVDLERIDGRYEKYASQKFRIDDGLVKIEKAIKIIEKTRPIEGKLALITEEIDSVNDRLGALEIQIRGIRRVISITEKLDRMKEGLAILGRLMEMVEIFDQRKSLKAGLRFVEDLEDDIQGKQSLLELHKNQYLELIKREGKCPTCFAPIDAKTISRIAREL